MEAYYQTEVGKVRSHNEDNVISVATLDNDYLLIVADGMGGHRAGEVASMITTAYLADEFMKIKLNTKEEAIEWLHSSASIINDKIIKYSDDNPTTKGLGTTLVACVITSQFTIMANIGDSSGYLVTRKELVKITDDHTLVNMLVKAGELTKEEARFHPRRNILMKALGNSTGVDIDIFEIIEDYEGILLCSDGLTNMITEKEILTILKKEKDIKTAVNALVTKANNRGGTDNISVAYYKRGEEDVRKG